MLRGSPLICHGYVDNPLREKDPQDLEGSPINTDIPDKPGEQKIIYRAGTIYKPNNTIPLKPYAVGALQVLSIAIDPPSPTINTPP